MCTVVTDEEKRIVDTLRAITLVKTSGCWREKVKCMVAPIEHLMCTVKPACLVLDKRSSFFNHISFIGTVHLFSKPALAIDAKGKELHSTFLDQGIACINHFAKIIVLIVATTWRRKDYNRDTRTCRIDWPISRLKMTTPVAGVFNMHILSPYNYQFLQKSVGKLENFHDMEFHGGWPRQTFEREIFQLHSSLSNHDGEESIWV